MSLFGVALSGLNASKQALDTTSHNIANANNPAYSRQQVQVSSIEGIGSGSGFVGRGVTVDNVRRLSNEFLNGRINSLASEKSYADARAGQLDQLDRLLADPSTSIGGAMQEFFKAAQDLSTRPNDESLKQTFVFAAEELASRFSELFSNAAVLSRQADVGVENSVQNINRLSAQIARLNLEISDSTTIRGSVRLEPNDLIDKRAQLIKELSEEIEIEGFANENGRISLNTKSGMPLVSETQSFELTTTSNSPIKVARSIVQSGKTIIIPLPNESLGQGRMAGLLEFRDTQLAKFNNSLKTMSQDVFSKTTAIQTGGAKPPLYSLVDGRLNVAAGFTTNDIAIAKGSNTNGSISAMAKVFDEGNPSVNQQYTRMLTDVGNTASQAKSDASAKDLILTQLETDKSSLSGVSLDEEAANLIRYQQSYSAAGKVIGLSKDLFQEILDMTR
ncbi:MAG: flagellar hook-associated protein FlgK [Burkholderiales bacterium]|nr:flagellar hook-associated protein FlgK [Burkholderiales bacterium]